MSIAVKSNKNYFRCCVMSTGGSVVNKVNASFSDSLSMRSTLLVFQ